MSELLNSGKIGVLDKGESSNNHIYDRWKDSGFLYGIDDKDESIIISLALEVAANFILMQQKIYDMMHCISGVSFYENELFDTTIFAIISRIIRKVPEAANFIPEIINDVKKECNTSLSKGVFDGEERYIDWQVEFCAVLSDKIGTEIIEKIKK